MDIIESPINIISGINPEPDSTPNDTVQFANGNNIRFYRGRVQTIGGHVSEGTGANIQGCPYTLFSFERDGVKHTIIGTHTHLYDKAADVITNITPLDVNPTALNDALMTTNASTTVTLTVGTHTIAVGDRISIASAAAVGGVSAADLNKEHFVTAITATTVDFEVDNAATSSVIGGGLFDYFTQIEQGTCDAENPYGYGIGLYGDGDIDDFQTDTTLFNSPRIWSIDNFGNDIVLCAGQNSPIYKWEVDIDFAPQVIANSPTANSIYVAGTVLVALGADGVANRRKNSNNTGDLTDWTIAIGSRAFEDDVEDVSKFLASLDVRDEILEFSEDNEIRVARYVGGVDVWDYQPLTGRYGLIAANAAVEAGGYGYWMDKDDFRFYNGGIVDTMPNNTLRTYVFDDINREQAAKCHAWHNKKFNEIWFHYPSAASIRCDRCVIYNIDEGVWYKREGLDRSASERGGSQLFDFPILSNQDGEIYQHENGYNDDGQPMHVWAKGHFERTFNGMNLARLHALVSDTILTGTMRAILFTKDQPQDTEMLAGQYDIANITQKTDFLHTARLRAWQFEQQELNGFFRIGGMTELKADAGRY